VYVNTSKIFGANGALLTIEVNGSLYRLEVR
jgi:hypothetical protein